MMVDKSSHKCRYELSLYTQYKAISIAQRNIIWHFDLRKHFLTVLAKESWPYDERAFCVRETRSDFTREADTVMNVF